MNQRYADILNGLVQEFIRTAEPVGSSHLCDSLALHMSSATVRNILRDLEEEGFLYQPHTSSGRVPTDRGYRYYVDNLDVGHTSRTQLSELNHTFEEYVKTYVNHARACAKLLADMAGCVGVTSWGTRGDLYEAGMAHMLLGMQSVNSEIVRELSNLVDCLDDSIEGLVPEKSYVTIYIGQEVPMIKTRFSSILAARVTKPRGDSIILLMIGPKRMPYRRNLMLLQNVAEVIQLQVPA